MKGDKTTLRLLQGPAASSRSSTSLHERFGVDTSDAAMRKAVAEFNELCDVITEIGNFRKLDNPPITGYEFHVIQLVSQVCPHDLILPYLKETLEEIKTPRAGAEVPVPRARRDRRLARSTIPSSRSSSRTCGAMVVADRYCFGSFPSRERIEIRGRARRAFDAICRHYLHWNQCARFMAGDEDRPAPQLRSSASWTSSMPTASIYENMKFCEFWSYEKVLGSYVLQSEMGVPCCTIEKEYALGSVGQLRTRFQAFVESLEIKKINA